MLLHIAKFSLLRRNSIMLYVYIHSYIHIFFIHSLSVNTDCFHILGIVKSAAVNIRVRVFFCIIVSPRYMPRSDVPV